MYSQLWVSVTAPLPATGIAMGSIINGRRLVRLISDSTPENTIQVLFTQGFAPVVLGVQLPDGSDYDAKKYPRNVKDYLLFMAQLNIFNNGLKVVDQTPNTGAGWAPFNLGE